MIHFWQSLPIFWALIPPDNIFALIFHQRVMRFILGVSCSGEIPLLHSAPYRRKSFHRWIVGELHTLHYRPVSNPAVRTCSYVTPACTSAYIISRIYCINVNTVRCGKKESKRERKKYLWAYLIVTDFPHGRTLKKHPQEESWDVRKTFSGSIRRGESVCSGTEGFPVGILLHFY